jgi:hypothetical protein
LDNNEEPLFPAMPADVYVPPSTQTDEHETLIEALQINYADLADKVNRMERLLAMMATAAIAATAAFDALRVFMDEYTGLGPTIYNQDSEEDK